MKQDIESKLIAVELEETQPILPLMASLFVDSFEPNGGDELGGYPYGQCPPYEKRMGRIFRLALAHEERESEPFYDQISLNPLQDSLSGDAGPSNSALCSLITGISKTFSNILMGVLGNATLIRLQLSQADTDYERSVRMERLIQCGSFMIHMVLGYLGERGSEGKRMRLQQLFKEMKAGVPNSFDGSDFGKLERRLQWASHMQSPRLIASSSARVLEVLFKEIQSFCLGLSFSKAGNRCIKSKVNAIDVLISRAMEATQALRWYAGEFKLKMARVQIVRLVQKAIDSLSVHRPGMRVNLEINRRVPSIQADRNLVGFAVRQILMHAIQAHEEDAELSIAVRKFQEEAPEERCGVHASNDYVVITVQGAGPGISPEIQKRIFEPFFHIPGRHGQPAIGLAAARSIVRAHRGYIQLQSSMEKGSIFKLYLPLHSTTAA